MTASLRNMPQRKTQGTMVAINQTGRLAQLQSSLRGHYNQVCPSTTNNEVHRKHHKRNEEIEPVHQGEC